MQRPEAVISFTANAIGQRWRVNLEVRRKNRTRNLLQFVLVRRKIRTRHLQRFVLVRRRILTRHLPRFVLVRGRIRTRHLQPLVLVRRRIRTRHLQRFVLVRKRIRTRHLQRFVFVILVVQEQPCQYEIQQYANFQNHGLDNLQFFPTNFFKNAASNACPLR